MRIQLGYDLTYDCPQPTPMVLMLNVHYSRASDLEAPDYLTTTPRLPITAYRDSFGNWCNRIVAPAGRTRISGRTVIRDTGAHDPVYPNARQHAVQDLPQETLMFLLGSRYCETDKLSEIAWNLFHTAPMGWGRVQAICDFVHSHISFGYEHARPTRTAYEAFVERRGVCRDFAHLGVALCRAMNIPARYCTGYLSDIGTPKPWSAMDFAGWFEAYLDGAWHTFDPRNNVPRQGRILIAYGRDAVDVPLTNTFGPNTLAEFSVITDEIP